MQHLMDNIRNNKKCINCLKNTIASKQENVPIKAQTPKKKERGA